MTKFSLKSYSDMNKMNQILKKHNIKYVALAGTILGLNRHGGIIPWDNDIDIGFIESEWIKLQSIRNELIRHKFTYNSNGINHCHFGNIDCFKLKLNNNRYEGEAKTICSIDEYNNSIKQVFGYTYINAPFCSKKSLSDRYGKDYFFIGDVNDNFHFDDKNVKRFNLNHNDLSFQIK